jgi:hypothetical protein
MEEVQGPASYWIDEVAQLEAEILASMMENIEDKMQLEANLAEARCENERLTRLMTTREYEYIKELEAEAERLQEEIVEKDDYIMCLEDDIQALAGDDDETE